MLGVNQMIKDQLIEEAKKIRAYAHVPYSKFRVGAAVLAKSGKIYTGCNIENAAYSVTCCAERVAIFKAVSEGETEFKAIAVAADTERPVSPCGSCRQVMSEFFDGSVDIHLSNLHANTKTITMDEILPFSFSSEDLEEK